MTRGRLIFLLAALAVFVGWQHLAIFGRETAVLHIPPTDRNQDTFVTLWVVEDAEGPWIRAESPSRLWLEQLRDDALVELTWNGRTSRYRASRRDSPETRAYVDRLFRAKYGPADRIRALQPGPSVPIRLARP
jgi:hypothetical protein